jgi:hypothetical protein
MVHQLRHRCPKGAATVAMNLRSPRHILTLLSHDHVLLYAREIYRGGLDACELLNYQVSHPENTTEPLVVMTLTAR